LYNSYENLIEKHNDKSNIKPVSAINSKFNTVLLGNKNIEREFCKENACNTHRDMNPCVDNDFYCSTRCTEETDSDCKKKSQITAQTTAPIEEEPKEEEIIEKTNKTTEEITETKQKNPKKYLIFILFYFIGLLIFQFIRYVRKFDIEDT
jgi:hypothetical protein